MSGVLNRHTKEEPTHHVFPSQPHYQPHYPPLKTITTIIIIFIHHHHHYHHLYSASPSASPRWREVDSVGGDDWWVPWRARTTSTPLGGYRSAPLETLTQPPTPPPADCAPPSSPLYRPLCGGGGGWWEGERECIMSKKLWVIGYMHIWGMNFFETEVNENLSINKRRTEHWPTLMLYTLQEAEATKSWFSWCGWKTRAVQRSAIRFSR